MTISHCTSLRSVSAVVASERRGGRKMRHGKARKAPRKVCFRISRSNFRIARASCAHMSSQARAIRR